MAWNTIQQGVTYHPPVAPEVPVADNTAAKIISAGSGAGLEMFTKLALARQNADLDHEKMLQDADLAAKSLAFKEKELANDYELKKMLYGTYQTNADANQERARTGVLQVVDRNRAMQEYQDSISNFDSEAQKGAQELQLTDADFQAKNPVQWAANLTEYKKRYGNAVVGGTPGFIKTLETQADQQTIPFVEGGVVTQGEYVRGAAAGTAKDEKGLTFLAKEYKPGGVTGGTSKQVPIWKIAKNYGAADDQGKAAIVAGLMAAGQSHMVQSFEKIGGKQVPKTTEELNPSVRSALEAGTKADFTRGKDQVPPILTRKMTDSAVKASDPGATSTRSGRMTDQRAIDEAAGATPDYSNSIPSDSNFEPAALPDQGAAGPAARTPAFEQSNTDKLIAQAKAVLNVNPSARDEIMRRLQAQGINPSMLA